MSAAPCPRRSKSPVDRFRGDLRKRWETQLSPLQRDEIDEAFRLILEEEEHDVARVDAAKLRNVLLALGHDANVSNELVEHCKVSDGRISLEDFCEAMSEHDRVHTTSEAQLEEAFQVFDKDGNKTVDATELNHVLTNLGFDLSEEEADEMLHLADTNEKDDVMTYDEFVKTLKETHQRKETRERSVCVLVAQFCWWLSSYWPLKKSLGDPIDFLEWPVRAS